LAKVKSDLLDWTIFKQPGTKSPINYQRGHRNSSTDVATALKQK
jgi:hypothetical protein